MAMDMCGKSHENSDTPSFIKDAMELQGLFLRFADKPEIRVISTAPTVISNVARNLQLVRRAGFLCLPEMTVACIQEI